MALASPPPPPRSHLSRLIRRARRRQLLLLALETCAFAFAFFLAGASVLLVSGLPSPAAVWLALLVAASAAFGLWRARPALPSPYLTAQLLDRRLHLRDTLSTAFHFSHQQQINVSPSVIAHQRHAAESAAASADLRSALPLAPPRASIPAAALVLLVAGLLAVRYGPARLPDLHAPLFTIPFDGVPLIGSSAARRAHKPARAADSAAPLPGDVPAPFDTAAANYDSAPDSALSTVDEPNVDNSAASPAKASTGAQNPPSREANDSRSDASDADRGPNPGRDGAAAPSSASNPDSSSAANARKNGSNSSQASSPSLMERARDAMADLLNKLKPTSTSARQSPSQNNSSNEARAQRQAGANASKASADNQQGAPDPNAQGESSAQPAQQQLQSSASRATGKNATRSDSPDAQSGIGSEDGEKQAHLAEQLAAMGKISQLIGKRSANVSGDMMVEVSNSSQQLKTQYSNKQATHSASGGDIDRDEVPLAYQQYVQQYFEQIRKQPPPKSAQSGASQ